MKKSFTEIFRSPAFWLLALAALFLGDLFLGGKMFLSRDMLSGFWQLGVFEAHSLLHGDAPFWNPYWGGGKPLIADTTSQAFYPPNILFALFAPALAMNLFWLLHLFIGGLGVWFFFRQINVSSSAAFIAGVSFMLGAWLVAQLEFPYNGCAGVWVPWIFGVLVRCHSRLNVSGGWWREVWRQRRLAGVLALLFAVQFFANFPEMIIYPGIAYAVYIIAVSVSERNWRAGAALTLFVGVGGFIGLLLTLPQIVSMWELLPFSERAGTFDSRFNMASMAPAHLLEAVFPFLGGFPGWPNTHWESGIFEWWIGAFYLGALPVVSAPFAFFNLNRARKIWVWVAVTLLVTGALLSLGENTPLYGWWHEYVPLMNRFRFPTKFLVLVVLGLLILAALGLDTLLRRPLTLGAKSKPLLLTLGGAVTVSGLFAAALWLNPELAVDLLGNPQAKIPAATLERAAQSGLAAWGFLLLAYGWVLLALKSRVAPARLAVAGAALAFINLLAMTRQIHPVAESEPFVAPMPALRERLADAAGYRAFSPYADAQQYLYADPRMEIYLWTRQAGGGGMWMADGVRQHYQAGTKLLKWQHLTRVMYSGNPAAVDCALDWFGVKWVVQGAPWQQVFWGNAPRDLRVAERNTALPRFKLFDTLTLVATDAEVLGRLEGGQVSSAVPLVETACLHGGKIGVSQRAPAPSPSAGAQPDVLQVEQLKSSRAILQTSAAGERLLWFGDTWYPGWRAFIDGREVPIYRTNYMFMGVEVPAGEHRIEFSFVPRHFALCAALSLTLLALTLTVIATGATRR